MNGINVIKDTLPMLQQVSTEDAKVLKKYNVPMFQGKLFEIDDYGNEIFIASNTVVLGGALVALQKLFNVAPTFLPPSLNEIYAVNTGVPTDINQTHIKLFGCGTGGSGMDFNSVIKPDFKQKEIADMVPFRVSDSDTLDGADADKYYFKRELGNGKNAWYLKEFDGEVIIRSLWKDSVDGNDGTEVNADVSGSNSKNLIESFGECILRISPGDIKEYFESIGRLSDAKYNSIGLFSGQKTTVGGKPEYVNVRLFSVVNLENVSVKDRTEITYAYRIYAAV